MNAAKRKALEAAGWRFGDAADFLELADEERQPRSHEENPRVASTSGDAPITKHAPNTTPSSQHTDSQH